MEYGYARCSTTVDRQDVNRQKMELKKLGIKESNIFWEYESGAKTDRKELNRLFEVVKQGDTIATTEVSRLTRSTKHLCEIMQMVQEKKLLLNIGGSFVVDCRKEDIDPMTKGMIMMWWVFAEMERDIISSRIKSGLENAKAKGSKIGRPERTIDNLPVNFLKYYPMLQNGSINISELARLSGLGRTSIYRYLNLIEKKWHTIIEEIHSKKGISIIEKTKQDYYKEGFALGMQLIKERIKLAAENGTPLDIDGRAYFIKSDIQNLRDIFEDMENGGL